MLTFSQAEDGSNWLTGPKIVVPVYKCIGGTKTASSFSIVIYLQLVVKLTVYDILVENFFFL